MKIPAKDGNSWAWVRIDADHLRWLVSYKWRLDTHGYPTTSVFDVTARKSTNLLLHRMVTNAPKGVVVDHRRRNVLDARRCMLRFANYAQNSANRRRLRRKLSAKYRGVTKHKTGRWQAQCKHADRNYYLGLFDTQEEAARAYNEKARRVWGPFALLNRIPERKAA